MTRKQKIKPPFKIYVKFYKCIARSFNVGKEALQRPSGTEFRNEPHKLHLDSNNLNRQLNRFLKNYKINPKAKKERNSCARSKQALALRALKLHNLRAGKSLISGKGFPRTEGTGTFPSIAYKKNYKYIQTILLLQGNPPNQAMVFPRIPTNTWNSSSASPLQILKSPGTLLFGSSGFNEIKKAPHFYNGFAGSFFKNQSNKSFLTYWLAPLIGLAAIGHVSSKNQSTWLFQPPESISFAWLVPFKGTGTTGQILPIPRGYSQNSVLDINYKAGLKNKDRKFSQSESYSFWMREENGFRSQSEYSLIKTTPNLTANRPGFPLVKLERGQVRDIQRMSKVGDPRDLSGSATHALEKLYLELYATSGLASMAKPSSGGIFNNYRIDPFPSYASNLVGGKSFLKNNSDYLYLKKLEEKLEIQVRNTELPALFLNFPLNFKRGSFNSVKGSGPTQNYNYITTFFSKKSQMGRLFLKGPAKDTAGTAGQLAVQRKIVQQRGSSSALQGLGLPAHFFNIQATGAEMPKIRVLKLLKALDIQRMSRTWPGLSLCQRTTKPISQLKNDLAPEGTARTPYWTLSNFTANFKKQNKSSQSPLKNSKGAALHPLKVLETYSLGDKHDSPLNPNQNLTKKIKVKSSSTHWKLKSAGRALSNFNTFVQAPHSLRPSGDSILYLNSINGNLKKFISHVPRSLKNFDQKSEKGLERLKTYSSESKLRSGKITAGYINSPTILMQHYKMFKKLKLAVKLERGTGKLDPKKIKKDAGSREGPAATLYRKVTSLPASLEALIENRLFLQKKRKAKKQRLETRRQKKRTRFFPRPIWLRFRLFSEFLKKSHLNQPGPLLNLKAASHNSAPDSFWLNKPTWSTTLTQGEGVANRYTKLPAPSFALGAKLSSPLEKFKTEQDAKAARYGRSLTALKLPVPKGLIKKLKGFYGVKAGPEGARNKKIDRWATVIFKKGTGSAKYKSSPAWRALEAKEKANYVNFKTQKQNNQPNQTSNISLRTMYRDLWVWAYNLTQTNLSNQIFLDKKQQLPVYWVLNKTSNKYSPSPVPSGSSTLYNKRYNLWTLQKVRNQSKNNKTVLLSKQLNSYWNNLFLKNDLTKFNKKILIKMRNSLQKLGYLNSSLDSGVLLKLERSQPEYPAPFLIFKGGSFNGVKGSGIKYKVLESSPWWVTPSPAHLLTADLASGTPNNKPLTSISQVVSAFPTLPAIRSEVPDVLTELKQRATHAGNNQTILGINSLKNLPVLLVSATLFHFCAIVSLISISQIRCFIKFHLILVYKLSNAYSHILYQVSNLTKTLLFRGSFKKEKERIDWGILKENKRSKLSNLQIKTAPHAGKNGRISNSLAQAGMPKRVLAIPLQNLKGDSLTELKLRTTRAGTYKAKSSVLIALSLKLFQKEFTTISLFSGDRKWYQKGTKRSAERGISPFKIRKASLFGAAKKDALLPRKIGARSAQGSRILNVPFIKINNKILSKSLNLNVLIFQYTIQTKSNAVFMAIYSKFLKTALDFIDLFQYTLRSISAFFEKPAEFTTTWIAYSFLVEWSSDLLTIIPENLDIAIWNTFAKNNRVTPISTTFFFANIAGANVKQGLTPLFYAGGGGYFTSVLTLLTISHLLQRRILFLFDFLLKTLSQPDADLLRRQEKGMLFWDIWADFLLTAADKYNINVAALSTIKAEQNNLIENLSSFPQMQPTIINPQEGNGRDKFFNFQYKTKNLNSALTTTLTELKLPLKLKKATLLPPLKKGSQVDESKSSMRSTPVGNYLFNHERNNLTDLISNIAFASKRNSHLNHNSAWLNQLVWSPQANNRSSLTQNSGGSERMQVNQFITYQSWQNNSDLFIDYHPPKSFTHLPIIKYNSMLQQPIGNLVCQIYSGIFTKQVSKNILLVSQKNNAQGQRGDSQNAGLQQTNPSPNYAGSQEIKLIQALAGETELKLISDNAKRYAIVNGGFAIGIKLLRDVFDKIKLNTPCIFLLEDIHLIGERRPMLISDYAGDENKTLNELFMNQRDEVHEKNQVIYQNLFHSIAHYKKPFKGDYSTAIPTNKYLTDLYRFIRSQTTNNLSLTINNNRTLKSKITSENSQNKNDLLIGLGSLPTHLQIQKPQSQLTPPANSPFSVLLLKDSPKELKNKVVQEFPWLGLPGEELTTKPRISYSVRAKVAMLAELSLSNLSAKLDMITDLLVIIDSVRGNKGFIVFATTDKPQLLDPALRRPGRLDETICLPDITNSSVLTSISNYEVIKMINVNKNIFSLNTFPAHYQPLEGVVLTPLKAPLFCNAKKESKSTALLLNLKRRFYGVPERLMTANLMDYNSKLLSQENSHPVVNLSNALVLKSYYLLTKNSYFLSSLGLCSKANPERSSGSSKPLKKSKSVFSVLSHNKDHAEKLKALLYYEVGKLIFNIVLGHGGSTFKGDSLQRPEGSSFLTFNTFNLVYSNSTGLINYLAMFGDYVHLIQQLMLLYSGKISVLLAATPKSTRFSPFSFLSSLQKSKLSNLNKVNLNFYPSGSSSIADIKDFQISTSLMSTFIQKRYLYNKNLIVPKLLSFNDGGILDEPPSPPFSNLLIPAKRFENYKRLLRDSIFGDNMGMYTNRKAINQSQLAEAYLQLSSIKQLKLETLLPVLSSTAPPKDVSTAGEIINNQNNFIKKLYKLKSLQNTTNINWYYQNRILKRHSQYLINQWWTGQLSEHNAEAVFLSDIDWRSSAAPKNNRPLTTLKGVATSPLRGQPELRSGAGLQELLSDILIKERSKNSNKDQGETFATEQSSFNSVKELKNFEWGQDVLLDFPDADQHYNPRRRRWLLTKGEWAFWFNFEKMYSQEILTHLVSETVIKTYKYLYNNGELLDYVTSKFMTVGYQLPLSSKQLKHQDLLKRNNFKGQKTGICIPDSLKELHLTNSVKKF